MATFVRSGLRSLFVKKDDTDDSVVYKSVAYTPVACDDDNDVTPPQMEMGSGGDDDAIAMHMRYTAEDKAHYLDLFVPPNVDSNSDMSLPVVVHIHGGGWQRGSRSQWFRGGPQFGKWAAKNNIVCAVVGYRLSRSSWFGVFAKTILHSAIFIALLALLQVSLSLPLVMGVMLAKFVSAVVWRWWRPVVQHPDHVEDCAAACTWVHRHVRDFCSAANTNAMFVSGHSAGAHLASLLALHPSYLKEAGFTGNIRGVLAISGIYTLHAPWQYFNWVFRCLYTMSYAPDHSAWQDASPITHVTPQSPPFLLLSAAYDCGLQTDAIRLCNSLERHGVEYDYHVISSTSHGSIATKFHLVDAHRCVLQFILQHM